MTKQTENNSRDSGSDERQNSGQNATGMRQTCPVLHETQKRDMREMHKQKTNVREREMWKETESGIECEINRLGWRIYPVDRYLNYQPTDTKQKRDMRERCGRRQNPG